MFWDNLYLDGCKVYDYEINRLHWKLLSNDVYTNNKKVYNDLQSKLRAGIRVKHMRGDIRNMPNRLKGKTFDSIMLSNIAHYVKFWNEHKSEVDGQTEFYDLVAELRTILSNDGFIQIDYAYNDRLKRYKKYADIYGNDKIKSATAYGNEGAIIYYPNGKNKPINEIADEVAL